MRIDPKLLIEFTAIAEERSFTDAARRLRVAQPWLSSRLRRLEKTIGFPLLTRTTRTVSLTEKGAELLAAASQVARAHERAERVIILLREGRSRQLRIGFAPYAKHVRERSELLDAFASSHPEVTLELEVGWSRSLLDKLGTGEIDLTFLVGDYDPERYRGLLLRRFGMALTMGRDHELAKMPSIQPHLLEGRTVEVYTRSLNAGLWEAMYGPLHRGGAILRERADLAEGVPDRVTDSTSIAAYLDFEQPVQSGGNVVRIPLDAPVAIPFSIVGRSENERGAAGDFWSLCGEFVSRDDR